MAPEHVNIEPICRSKDVVYVKETVPATVPARPSVPANVYPIPYPPFPPPTYYQVYDYCGIYPEMQTFDNVGSVYPAPQLIPMYSEEVYPPNGQIICQPLLPHHSQ